MPKWTKSKTINGIYKDFKYRKDKSSPHYLSKKQYREFVEDYFNSLVEYLISGKTYKVPHGLGEFRIIKYKPKTKPRNFKAEVRYYERNGVWKKIPLQNFHSNGERIKITWFTRDYPLIPNKGLVRFSSVRSFRNKISHKLLTEGSIEDYYKVQKSTKLNKTNVLI